MPLLRNFAAASLLAASLASAQTTQRANTDTTAKEIRDADKAYLAGVKQLIANHPDQAADSFQHAASLNPHKVEYALALTVAREHLVTSLVQQAARERNAGHEDNANALVRQAQVIDPNSVIVTEHLPPPPIADPLPVPVGADELSKLGDAPRLKPSLGSHAIHVRGDTQQLLREIYRAWNIAVTFDPSVTSHPQRFDVDDISFAGATNAARKMTHTFAVPLTADSVLIADETEENRSRLMPLVEETVFVPAMQTEQLTELANIAKNVFDIKQAAVSPSSGKLVLRGPADALDLVDATYADMLDGGAEILLDVKFYEVDRTHTHDIGAILPSSAGVFSVAAEAQNIVSQNQSLVNQLIASGAIQILASDSYLTTIAKEAFGLLAAGLVSPTELTNTLGYFGSMGSFSYNGKTYNVPFGGIYLGSATSFNLALQSSDTRLFDDIQLRVSNNQIGSFRSGTRFPITTSTYSSGISSALTSKLAGVSIGGTSVASLLAQYQGVTVPQIQYEDLGLTMKATPVALKSGSIAVHIDLKIESLGGGMVDNIPILNSRQLIEDVIVPEGATAMLASLASSSELHAVTGVPGLSEIPGFVGTDKNVDHSSQELLITITPHLARRRSNIVTTRRLIANLGPVAQ